MSHPSTCPCLVILLGVSIYYPHFEWEEFEFRFLEGEIGKGGKQHFEGGVQTREETMQFICLTNAFLVKLILLDILTYWPFLARFCPKK